MSTMLAAGTRSSRLRAFDRYGIVAPMALHHGSSEDRVRDTDANPFVGEANPAFGSRVTPPLQRLANDPVPSDVAYQVIHDELLLDGSARLNLASFVTTWMEPNAQKLMAECFDKNLDKDEYPQTAELERRCVAILADLWNAPEPDSATGCSTTGSSEACMLAGMALKRRWAARIGGTKPNLVMGANVQVCWEKFCRYWDVEPRMIPMAGERFHLDADTAAAAVDENTIGVVAILGSTFDGSYEPVEQIAAALDSVAANGGPDVPIHVDGASGAMIAPFLDTDLVWDFRLPRVASINTSGHKYGLVYPGVGWVLWRDAAALPEELIFKVNYLGGEMPTFALNFSRPGAEVVAQYYTFFRLGRAGFRAVQQASRDVATYLAREIGQLEEFRLISRGEELPVFAFTTSDQVTGWDVFAVSRRLRERGWQVPAYTFPPNREDLAVLRIVCRNAFSLDLADLFLADLRAAVGLLNDARDRATASGPQAFHH
jgi:glutamate decarboxylase